MADRNGYIGRAPGDSSVVVARQIFEPTGVTTDFTFVSGYTIGYVDAYLNGARLIEGQDYTATNGSIVSLVSSATNGDVLELVAYKAFNVATVDTAPGNLSVGNNLTVGGDLTVTGFVTANGGYNIGIQSAGNIITSGPVTTLNFVGTGNTFAVNGTTVDISIAGGGGGGGSGVSTTGVSTAAIWSNPSFITTSYTLDDGNNNYGVFGPISVAVGATINVGAGNTFVIV
jgi:hypothetical protein